jgi:hypothetical protein
LKACIVAALASIWGIRDMFLAQLNAVNQVLHAMHSNCLVVIQQMGAGKTHILWTLGVIGQRIVLIFIPLLTLSTNIMSKFMCANLCFGSIISVYLIRWFILICIPCIAASW